MAVLPEYNGARVVTFYEIWLGDHRSVGELKGSRLIQRGLSRLIDVYCASTSFQLVVSTLLLLGKRVRRRAHYVNGKLSLSGQHRRRSSYRI